MKILLIDNYHYYYGGAETVFFNTARILRNHGHQVITFSYKRKENIESDYDSFFVKPKEEKNKVNALLEYFYNAEAKKKLELLINQEKPDIAHSHLFWCGIGVSIFSVLKKYNIPHVHTAHDYRMICPAYLFKDGKDKVCEKCQGKYFYNCTINKCSKGSLFQSVVMTSEMYFRNQFYHPADNLSGIIYVSNFSRQKHLLYEPRFKNIKSIILYNSVALNETKNEKNTLPYFLYFGRLSREKGILTLVNTFLDLPDKNLKIVGTGILYDEIREITKESKNIEVLGYMSGKQLHDIVADAHFVIIPSEWYENNPMTIIEAYSLGVPVIGSNIGGIPEIIEEEKTGFIIEPNSVISLKNAVNSASQLTDEQYLKMSNFAIDFARRNFEETNYYQSLINFYNEIMQLKGSI